MVATRAEDTMPATPSHLAVESLPAPGTKIGRYTVVDKVGAGGMGVVYRAHDPSLDRDIAIKLVRPTRLRGSGGEQHRARLLREARALAQLQHQNVIRIYDVGEHGEALFFAMEYVLGKDAEQWVTAEAPAWPRIVGVYRAAGRGLSAAHGAGLVHRDFKPANILVGDDNRVRVLDFGLARDAEDLQAAGRGPAAAGDTDAVTADGIVVGTPAYMAPEQLSGLPADARSDQYSYCLSLWESLFEELPFKGEDNKAMAMAKAKGAIEEPPATTDVPKTLVDILARGMSPDPKKRFATMPDLLRKLRSVSEQAQPGAPEPSASSPRAAALPWLAFGIATVIAAALWLNSAPPDVACEDTTESRQQIESFRADLSAGRTDEARQVARVLADTFAAQGCPARALDWATIARP